MTESEELGPLEPLAAAAVARPVGPPPTLADVAGRVTRRRRRRAAGVGVLVLAGFGVGAALWNGGVRAPTVTEVANEPAPVDEPDPEGGEPEPDDSGGGVRLVEIAAVGGPDGTEQVDLRVEGVVRDLAPQPVGSLADAVGDRISYYVATPPDALQMCGNWHGWGGAIAAVGVTMPADWFETATLEVDGPIIDGASPDGEPARVAKIITCTLDSGLWQITIHGPRSGLLDDVSVDVVDGAIRISIDEAEVPGALLLETSDLWLRREAGVVVGDMLVVPGLAQRNPTDVHLLAVDLATGEERVIAAPDGLLIGEQAPVGAEPRPILTVWRGRVVVCCSGFGGGSISLYDPTGDSWTPLADLPGDFLDAVVVTERGLLALGRDGAALLDAPDSLWQVVAESPPVAPDAHRFWTASALGEAVLFWPVHFSRNIELGFVLDLTTGVWQAVPAPEDDFLVPAAATSVVADGRFLLVGGQPEVFAELSEALVVLTLDPQTLAWAEPQFPLPEPDSFEGNIGSQRLLPSADGRLVFDTGALGGDMSLLEIDAATGVASAITVADPADVIAVRADGALLRRPQPQ